MKNKVEKLINELTYLLLICNDGKEGFKNAAELTNTPELQSLFVEYSEQRSAFAETLKTYIHTLGGDADNDTGGTLGILHRRWMDIKSVLSLKNDKVIMDTCITGERAAVEAYDKVLMRSIIEPGLKKVLMSQRDRIMDIIENVQEMKTWFSF